MLAPNNTPNEFDAWNRKHKAPFGPRWWSKFVYLNNRLSNFAWSNRMNFPHWLLQTIGPFGFQVNSCTRTYEYPWCFFTTPLEPGMRILEIGAGASGFQFVLAKCGLEVTSVDPLVNPTEEVDWVFSCEQFEHLNNAFGGKVKFIRDFLQNAQLDSNQYDRVFSISVIEHIPQAEVVSLIKEIERILKPGGFFIATIDLFLDCYPFTSKASNRFGSNISIRSLIEQTGLTPNIGNSSELYGYPEFDPDNIRKRLNEFLVVNDVLTQCLVLEKAL